MLARINNLYYNVKILIHVFEALKRIRFNHTFKIVIGSLQAHFLIDLIWNKNDLWC